MCFAAAMLMACSGDGDVNVNPVGAPGGGSNPQKQLLEPGKPAQSIYDMLDMNQCNMPGSTVQIQQPHLLAGPERALLGDTRLGFYVAWSACNATSDVTPAVNYQLLDSVDGGTAQNLHGFTVPSLAKCGCHSEIVFINEPIGGNDSDIALVPPTLRLTPNLGLGTHTFRLSPPFDGARQIQVTVK